MLGIDVQKKLIIINYFIPMKLQPKNEEPGVFDPPKNYFSSVWALGTRDFLGSKRPNKFPLKYHFGGGFGGKQEMYFGV